MIESDEDMEKTLVPVPYSELEKYAGQLEAARTAA